MDNGCKERLEITHRNRHSNVHHEDQENAEREFNHVVLCERVCEYVLFSEIDAGQETDG